VVDQL